MQARVNDNNIVKKGNYKFFVRNGFETFLIFFRLKKVLNCENLLTKLLNPENSVVIKTETQKPFISYS